MSKQEYINYTRIAEPIEYIRQNHTEQPSLKEIAKKIHLSPFHFQKMFTDWAGVSPKKFLQFISVQHAKQILNNSQTTLLETASKRHRFSVKSLGNTFKNSNWKPSNLRKYCKPHSKTKSIKSSWNCNRK